MSNTNSMNKSTINTTSLYSAISRTCTTTIALFFLLAGSTQSVAGFTTDFEDVGASLGTESFYNGSDGAGGFTSGGLLFNNTFGSSGGFDFWDGWSFSNITDNTTPGFGNQYSSIFGMGDGGSSTYGVAFSDTATVDAGTNRRIQSFSITNTAYAALSMRDGDSFAKQFGGSSGNDPDFLKIDIDGFDETGNLIGTQEFFLADYRFADNTMDYIVDQWTTVDVGSLNANRIGFRFSGSDVGQFGLNTPTYFAADNFVVAVPEPHVLGVFPAFAWLLFVRRNRK
jgi:hypothetical protein